MKKQVSHNFCDPSCQDIAALKNAWISTHGCCSQYFIYLFFLVSRASKQISETYEIRMNLTNKHDKVILESKILSGVNYTVTSNLDSYRQAQQRLPGSHLCITGLMG